VWTEEELLKASVDEFGPDTDKYIDAGSIIIDSIVYIANNVDVKLRT
jgi:hypothetical protein